MKRALLMLLLATSLAGCNKLFPPDFACSDEPTTALVRQIFNNELEQHLGNPAFTGDAQQVMSALVVSVTAIRTSSHDKKIGKYECKAELAISMPSKAMQLANVPLLKNAITGSGINITGNGIKGTVTYSSQLTDDKTQQYVEMLGHYDLADAIAGIAIAGGFDNGATLARNHASSYTVASAAEEASAATEAAWEATTSAESTCVDEKAADYAKEAGELAPPDMLEAWRAECAVAE